MSYHGLLRGTSHQDSVIADSEIGRHGRWRDHRSRYTKTAILAHEHSERLLSRTPPVYTRRSLREAG